MIPDYLKDKPALPEGEFLDARYIMGRGDWYVRIRGRGWFYLLGQEWRSLPLGPPGSSYPKDFDDEAFIATQRSQT